jgi:AraC-like DNA-binding protein
MDLKQIAKDTTKTLISYLTFQAMRTVLDQLSETDPPRALKLHEFSLRERVEHSEAYLQALFKEDQGLAFRILTVREHIATEIVDFLPEMLQAGIQQANMEQRRQQLERMTQVDPTVSAEHPEQDADLQTSEEAGELGNDTE